MIILSEWFCWCMLTIFALSTLLKAMDLVLKHKKEISSFKKEIQEGIN
jgi:hypothetical protein